MHVNRAAVMADLWLVGAPCAWLAGRTLVFNLADRIGWPTTWGPYPPPNRAYFTGR